MKMKKNYYVALGIFMIVIMATLVFQYKHFKFQTYHINSYHHFVYGAQTDAVSVTDYFGAVSSYYGGAVVNVASDEKTLQAEVNLEDGTVCEHTLTKQEDGSYLMDVVFKEGVLQIPQKMTVKKKDGTSLGSADLSNETGALYQSNSYDYSFLNIYINQSGIFMGQFEAFDKTELLEKYQLVTIEFCHPDASKSSGYQLLSRTQMNVSDFLEKEDLGYLPFLATAHFDPEKTIEVIITFENEGRQAIVMTLEKGEQS